MSSQLINEPDKNSNTFDGFCCARHASRSLPVSGCHFREGERYETFSSRISENTIIMFIYFRLTNIDSTFSYALDALGYKYDMACRWTPGPKLSLQSDKLKP